MERLTMQSAKLAGCLLSLFLLMAGCGKSGQDATTESEPEVSETADVVAATTEMAQVEYPVGSNQVQASRSGIFRDTKLG